jgi:hypothetical protein
MSVGARFAGGDLGDTPASPPAATPRRARPTPTGGVFGYWFGPPHPQADTSAVFTELVYRIRAGRYKLTPQETAALRRCESDLQVRAITSGYVAGAATHAALGAVRAPAAPRWAAAASAGVLGAYVGAQTIARECLRSLVDLPDSQLGGECRAIVARLAPGDPLGEPPAAPPGKPAPEWRRIVSVPPAVAAASVAATRARAARDERRRDTDEGCTDVRVEAPNFERFDDDVSASSSTRDPSVDDVAFDVASSSRVSESESESTRGDSYRRRVDSGSVRAGPAAGGLAKGGGMRGATSNDGGDAFGGGGFAVAGFRVSGRDAWGTEREDEPSSVAVRGDEAPRHRVSPALRREMERRAAMARKGAEARRRRRGGGDEGSARGGAEEPPIDAASDASRDELRDPAGRLGGFGERGTRRNAYGDVLDR